MFTKENLADLIDANAHFNLSLKQYVDGYKQMKPDDLVRSADKYRELMWIHRDDINELLEARYKQEI